MTDVSHTNWARCSEPHMCDTFDILTFAISIVDILTFLHCDCRHFDCRHCDLPPKFHIKIPNSCWENGKKI